jgi:signal transduction histidine kinase
VAFLVDVETERRFELGTLTTIGRDESSTIQLDDPAVAPRHAEIRKGSDGRFHLVDLGTRQGTFRGDRRVSDALLSDGDEVVVGPRRLRFDGGGAAERTGRSPYRPASEIADAAQLRRDYEKLRASFELSQALCQAQGLDAILAAVLDTAFRLLDADRGAIVLLDASSYEPMRQLSRRRDGESGDVLISTNVLSRIISTRTGLVIADTGNDELFNRSASLFAQSVRSAMCVPMLCSDELVGLVHLDSRAASGIFTTDDLELFAAIAGQAAVAIRGAQLSERVQEVATAERKRLARLVRDLPDAVVVLGPDRRASLLNSRAEELLPLLCDLSAPVERVGTHALDDLLLRPDSSDVVLPGTARRIVAVRASESSGPRGNELVLVLREVTEHREQQSRSAQQERLALIGQLAAGIAHDFNNVLQVISNCAEIMRDTVQDADGRECLADIERAASRASDVTRQLLAFGRRDVFRPRVIALERAIGSFEKLLRRSLREDVALELRLGGASRVKIDPGKLEQVLLNLAVNARDAMPSGGRFAVETSRVELGDGEATARGVSPGRYASLAVSDTGTGMPPEVATRVFEPFFTTKEPGKGTGLGLATVYGIVRQAGGAIDVRSEPGSGTTFSILLPETDEPLDADGRPAPVARPGTETVLVAEDEDVVRQLTARILRTAGYVVLEAACGDAALAEATRHGARVHLLLTDLVMPGMSGKELAHAMRLRSPGTRLLFMSGYFEHSVNPGGSELLEKPFTREKLLDAVRSALDAPAKPQVA